MNISSKVSFLTSINAYFGGIKLADKIKFLSPVDFIADKDVFEECNGYVLANGFFGQIRLILLCSKCMQSRSNYYSKKVKVSSLTINCISFILLVSPPTELS